MATRLGGQVAVVEHRRREIVVRPVEEMRLNLMAKRAELDGVTTRLRIVQVFVRDKRRFQIDVMHIARRPR